MHGVRRRAPLIPLLRQCASRFALPQGPRVAAVMLALLATAGGAGAETLQSALSRAYANNPDLNQSRASVRARDEDAPKAAAGMRPKASIAANAGPQSSSVKIPAGRNQNSGQRQYYEDAYIGYPRGAALNLSQTLFDGGRTANSVRQAESSVLAARAGLRQTEQTILQNAATAYMNVLRDTAILNLRQNNVRVLEEQLRLTRDRFGVGEVTRTDIAQAEASLAQARSDFYAAQAVLKISAATYRQFVGVDPRRLEPAQGVEGLLPASLNEAIDIALAESPAVINAEHQIDAAALAVKVAEGALSPTFSVSAQVSPQWDFFWAFQDRASFPPKPPARSTSRSIRAARNMRASGRPRSSWGRRVFPPISSATRRASASSAATRSCSRRRRRRSPISRP